MKWGSNKVTINNYSDIFKDYSKDIKEVIRSAILDDTPIEKYIDLYKGNPYMLWQVKMSLDEGIEEDLIRLLDSGIILKELRDMNIRGININPLKKYFKRGLSYSHYEYILKWYKEGYVLDKYDFDILPTTLLEVFDYGLHLGYSMDIFNNGVPLSRDYILNCIRIMSNGKSVDKFLKGDWDIENLILLSRFSKSRYYDRFIGYIDKEITPSVLEELYFCCMEGVPLDEVAVKNSDGVYVYSGIHISKIREAFNNNWDYKELLNPDLSIKELNKMIIDMQYNSNKKLSGRLRKKLI